MINNHIYEFKRKGKTYQREQGMLFPNDDNRTLDSSYDPESRDDQLLPPCLHKSGRPPRDGKFVLTRVRIEYPIWYCPKIRQVPADQIIIDCYTTVASLLDDHDEAPNETIAGRFSGATFLRTWCRGYSKEATAIPPRSTRLLKEVYFR